MARAHAVSPWIIIATLFVFACTSSRSPEAPTSSSSGATAEKEPGGARSAWQERCASYLTSAIHSVSTDYRGRRGALVEYATTREGEWVVIEALPPMRIKGGVRIEVTSSIDPPTADQKIETWEKSVGSWDDLGPDIVFSRRSIVARATLRFRDTSRWLDRINEIAPTLQSATERCLQDSKIGG